MNHADELRARAVRGAIQERIDAAFEEGRQLGRDEGRREALRLTRLRSAGQRAEEVLVKALADGEFPASRAGELAEAAGVSLRTLIEVRSRLGIASIRRAGRWFWINNATVQLA